MGAEFALSSPAKAGLAGAEDLTLIVRARSEAERACQAALFTSLVVLAATRFGGQPPLALSGAGDRASQQLRDVAMYLMHTQFKFTQAQVAAVAGLVRYSAGRAIQRIEDARDDGVFNWKLQGLETLAADALRAAA